MSEPATISGQIPAVIALLELARRARRASSEAELRFLAVNDTHALSPYRQAVLVWQAGGVQALSGAVSVEGNAPYVQWLGRLLPSLLGRPAGPLAAAELPGPLAADWAEWLPEHACWLPFPPDAPAGGLLLARELPWIQPELVLLQEWIELWYQAWSVRQGGPARKQAAGRPPPNWYRRPWAWAAGGLAGLLFVPVHLSVLAPGELVPASPAVVRAPLDGVIDVFHVAPNSAVREGQPLFSFEERQLRARLQVARQALVTAETEYRQATQQALADSRVKAQLATLAGRIEERRVESTLLESQLAKAAVLSPRDGIALFDDPTDWIGRPVTVGERILRVADPADVEIEAWLTLADAIPLPDDAPVALFLNATPLAPVNGRLRYYSHEATARPDGTYSYRLRASLDAPTAHRVGLKGTVRLEGRRVPLAYWILRRPWARVRTFIGL